VASKSSSAKVSKPAASPYQALIDQAAKLTKGKTPAVGFELVVVALYPNADGSDLDKVELGTMVGSMGRSAQRPAKNGKPQGGNVNCHVHGKLGDPRSAGVRVQVGANLTLIGSNAWE